jgi:hypothetical protein
VQRSSEDRNLSTAPRSTTPDQAHHPRPKDQRANHKRRGSKGGPPIGFDTEIYKRRDEVERTINRLKNSRVVTPCRHLE